MPDLKFGQVFIWRPGEYDIPVMVIAPTAFNVQTWKIVILADDDKSEAGGFRGDIEHESAYLLLDPNIYLPVD